MYKDGASQGVSVAQASTGRPQVLGFKREPGGRVAGTDLEGEQVAILQPHAAVSWPRNGVSLLLLVRPAHPPNELDLCQVLLTGLPRIRLSETVRKVI